MPPYFQFYYLNLLKKVSIYNYTKVQNSFHPRCTNGKMLNRAVDRSRSEEVALSRMRVNRAPFLRQVAHKFGRVNSDLCPNCELAPETSEHYLFLCPRGRISETKSSVRILTTMSYRKNPPKSWTIFVALGIYALPICDGIHSKQQQHHGT